jgi:hypothetical protein
VRRSACKKKKKRKFTCDNVAVTVNVVGVACSSHAGKDGLIVSGLPTRSLAQCILSCWLQKLPTVWKPGSGFYFRRAAVLVLLRLCSQAFLQQGFRDLALCGWCFSSDVSEEPDSTLNIAFLMLQFMPFFRFSQQRSWAFLSSGKWHRVTLTCSRLFEMTSRFKSRNVQGRLDCWI